MLAFWHSLLGWRLDPGGIVIDRRTLLNSPGGSYHNAFGVKALRNAFALELSSILAGLSASKAECASLMSGRVRVVLWEKCAVLRRITVTSRLCLQVLCVNAGNRNPDDLVYSVAWSVGRGRVLWQRWSRIARGCHCRDSIKIESLLPRDIAGEEAVELVQLSLPPISTKLTVGEPQVDVGR